MVSEAQNRQHYETQRLQLQQHPSSCLLSRPSQRNLDQACSSLSLHNHLFYYRFYHTMPFLHAGEHGTVGLPVGVAHSGSGRPRPTGGG